VFCEGGARVASSLLHNDFVDRLTLFYAPLFIGPGGIDPFRGLTDQRLDVARRWFHVRTANFGADSLISVER
jgi:diaminohydroxyphosphoribosylaminopyrimidine deaminase/5-amino-6-(5-phosphoribosylamino)uracil reductase